MGSPAKDYINEYAHQRTTLIRSVEDVPAALDVVAQKLHDIRRTACALARVLYEREEERDDLIKNPDLIDPMLERVAAQLPKEISDMYRTAGGEPLSISQMVEHRADGAHVALDVCADLLQGKDRAASVLAGRNGDEVVLEPVVRSK